MGKYVFDHGDEAVRIDIYGDIGASYWDDDSVSAKDFAEQVRQSEGKPLDIHVNSGGGSVFDAYAMMTAIRAHNAPVTVHIDGIAASAASYFPAAADKVLIAPEAWMMIHNASGACYGNRHDMEETAEFLGKVDQQISSIYAKRAERIDVGKTAEDYAEMMDATTWFTAEEAVECGLADEVEEFAVGNIAATVDEETIASAPEAVRDLIGAAVCELDVRIDGVGNVEPAEQEPAAAEARVYCFDGKVFTIR